jgi:hypothetical protein
MRHLNDFQSHIREVKNISKSSLNEEDLMRLEDILQFVIDDWGLRPKNHENELEKMTYEFILKNYPERILLRVDILDPEVGFSEYTEKKQRFKEDMFNNFSKRAWRHGYSVESLIDFVTYNPSTWRPIEMLKWVITKI